MKSKEELGKIKEEYTELNKKLAELTEDELAQVTGGREQIILPEEQDQDVLPPGHHPENDDDDPYGGKYTPIWVH